MGLAYSNHFLTSPLKLFSEDTLIFLEWIFLLVASYYIEVYLSCEVLSNFIAKNNIV